MRRHHLTLAATALLAMLVAADGRAQNGGDGGDGGQNSSRPDAVAAALFGVTVGSPVAALETTARRQGAECRPAGSGGGANAQAVAIVCVTPPVAPPFAAASTYWYADGVLDRAFIVDSLTSSSFADYQTHFWQLHRWVTQALGPPARPVQLPPAWTGGRPPPDAQQMADLIAGRVRLSATWELRGSRVELWLAGERGRPALVVGLRRRAAARTPAIDCGPAAISEALLDLFPPASDEVRARSARRLAACRMARAAGALDAALEHDPAPEVQAEALRALEQVGRPPAADELARLQREAPPAVAAAAGDLLAARASAEKTVTAQATAPVVKPAPPASSPQPPPPPLPPTPTATGATPARPPAVAAMPRPAPIATAPPAAPAPPAPPPPPARPRGPLPGTPLAIAASTVAGAALMRNLGLMGGDGLAGVTPQLLLGTTGAVIGFGTSWGLSRFGFRPTMEQAAWFTNTTAWGTLAGLTAWSASGSTSPKLQYGALVLGQGAGMGLGVWSAHRYHWTAPQIVLADSFVLGAGLSALGVGLMRTDDPHVTPVDAVATPMIMVAAAVAAHQMNPTANDLRLMTFGALTAGWTGGLLAAGGYRTDFLASRQSQGGAIAGLGFGYLGAAAAGAFTEADGGRLAAAGAGMLAGNVLGLGLHLTVQGFTHDNPPGATFEPGEITSRALSAGIGGVVLGGAAYAYAPYLHAGPRAPSMALTGALYGAGTWWLASAAAYHGQPVTEIDTAALEGGVLTGAALGGISGLVASRWFSPDPVDQVTTAASTGLGMSAGLGIAKLTTANQGTPDALGVLLGAGAGFGAGAWATHRMQLRAPDVGAGVIGLGYGTLLGALAPTLRHAGWSDTRATAGGTLLGLSLGAAGSATAAHLTRATGPEIAVPSFAGVLGLGMGAGAGLMWPCDPHENCTTQAPRIGAVAGPVLLIGGALALEPELHLARGLGPGAPALALSGAAFGGAWGLMAAGAIDPSGLISTTPSRQLRGGVLLGTTAGVASGLALGQFYAPSAGDLAFTFAASAAGGALGLGIPKLATATAGRFDTVGLLAGSSAGMVAGALLAPRLTLQTPALLAATLGTGAGALVGTLAPSLFDVRWDGGRLGSGGALVGGALGGGGALAAAYLSRASEGQVVVAATGGALGLGMGFGTGLMWPTTTSRPARIGTAAGTVGGVGLSLIGDHWLHLSRGTEEGAGRLATAGGLLGVSEGLLLAGAVDASGVISSTPERQRWGGALLGGSAGIATGLVLSARYAPSTGDLAFVTAADVTGGALGLGIAQLAYADTGRHDTVATLIGASGGLLAGAWLTPRLQLTDPDVAAALLGAGYGALVGTLAPSLDDATWAGGRTGGGGALVGASLGATGALAAAHLTGASAGGVAVPATAGLLGIGVGLGVGLAIPGESLRPARIGTVAGAVGGLALGAAAVPALALDQGLGPNAGELGMLGTAFGVADGLMIAGALDPEGIISATPARQREGGVLMGASAELAAGLVASKLVRLRDGDGIVLSGGKLLGGAMGLGVALVTRDHTGRPDTLATLGGSIGGLGAAAVTQVYAPLDGTDAAAAFTGAGFGAVLGALTPTLGETTWGGLDRRLTGGGLLLGISGGAIGGAALRHATAAGPNTVAVTALGGADGLLTGLGIGLLAHDDTSGGDRAQRIGVVAGTTAGLGIGALAWPRLTLGPDGMVFTAAASALGGWTGAWLPVLGHADARDVSDAKVRGGLLAGAGVASFGGSLLAPALHPDRDLIVNAVAVDALWTGAGAGAGALISTRDDAPVWGMLGAGTAGLLLGGALHRSIDIDGRDAPLLSLAGAEGLWLGGWLPNLLHDSSEVTDRQRTGGLAAGALGGLGLATVASGALELEPGQAAYAGLGSGLGASVAGGVALMTPELHDQRGVGLMLGGTAVGLAAGAAFAPRLSLAPTSTTAGAAAVGGTLGASEALLFAWSGRAQGGDQYGGAALLGGGVGATLGLAAASTPSDRLGSAPAAAGFAAWGAWMGSFTGSLFKNDAHEIVMGGLAGSNVGFLGGYALLRSGVVDARDFGWLSLFGALGTVAGAAAGAPFASRTEPGPVLAGLAAGPAVGMLGGALILPRLRRMVPGSGAQLSFTRLPARALRAFGFGSSTDAAPAEERVPDRLTLSSDIVSADDGPGQTPGLLRTLSHVVRITDWSPLIGALPAPDQTGPTPLLFGVTGLWH